MKSQRISSGTGHYGWADLAPLRATLLRHWLLGIGVLGLALPTMYNVATETWSTEQGAHGPIILATASWLFARRWGEVRALAHPGKVWIALAVFSLAAPLYIAARTIAIVEIEGLTMYGL